MTKKRWVSAYEVKAGDLLEADAGFLCIANGTRLRVEGDGGFFTLHVPCARGKHYLYGAQKDDVLIGFHLVEPGQKKKKRLEK